MMQVHQKGKADYHIDGSPATCANLAVYDLVPDADLLLSGPNIGHNAGRCSIDCHAKVLAHNVSTFLPALHSMLL